MGGHREKKAITRIRRNRENERGRGAVGLGVTWRLSKCLSFAKSGGGLEKRDYKRGVEGVNWGWSKSG